MSGAPDITPGAWTARIVATRPVDDALEAERVTADVTFYVAPGDTARADLFRNLGKQLLKLVGSARRPDPGPDPDLCVYCGEAWNGNRHDCSARRAVYFREHKHVPPDRGNS